MEVQGIVMLVLGVTGCKVQEGGGRQASSEVGKT